MSAGILEKEVPQVGQRADIFEVNENEYRKCDAGGKYDARRVSGIGGPRVAAFADEMPREPYHDDICKKAEQIVKARPQIKAAAGCDQNKVVSPYLLQECTRFAAFLQEKYKVVCREAYREKNKQKDLCGK